MMCVLFKNENCIFGLICGKIMREFIKKKKKLQCGKHLMIYYKNRYGMSKNALVPSLADAIYK